MPKEYKENFKKIIAKKIGENYLFIKENIINVNNKPFKYVSFNIDKELLICAIDLAKEKSNYTMALNQAGESRDMATKIQKCAQGVLAEMFIHVLLTQRYGFEVKRYDLERETFDYNTEEYDLKIITENCEYEVESRSSNIYTKSLNDFILTDVIIGPYGNRIKTRDELADFHFRPIYKPKFIPFVYNNDKKEINKEIINGTIQLIITGVASKDDFINHQKIVSLNQRGTKYSVVDAHIIGDIDEMDKKFKKIRKEM